MERDTRCQASSKADRMLASFSICCGVSAMIYAGIGSRETPEEVLLKMEKIAFYLSQRYDALLRSGGAIGADSTFEAGCDRANGKKEIFYAKEWQNKIKPTKETWEEAERIASKIHPAWDRCNEYARKLHSRNCFQILGSGLGSPVDFVVCYAKEDKNGNPQGGTRTAIVLAREHSIPVYNLFVDGMIEELRRLVIKQQ